MEGSFSLKSGNDILKGLVSKSSYNKNVPPSMEKEKTSSLPVNANQFSDDEKDDSALVFKKPKPYYRSRKKKISTPKIKTVRSVQAFFFALTLNVMVF